MFRIPSVFETESAKRDHAVLDHQVGRDLDQHPGAVDGLGTVHDRRPQRAGVIDRDIDGVAPQRIEEDRRPHIGTPADSRAGGLELHADQLGQDVLLGETF